MSQHLPDIQNKILVCAVHSRAFMNEYGRIMDLEHFIGSDPHANLRRLVAGLIRDAWGRTGSLMGPTLEHDVYRYCQTNPGISWDSAQPYVQWLLQSFAVINDWQQILYSFRQSLEEIAAQAFLNQLLQSGATMRAENLNKAIDDYQERIRRDLTIGNQEPELLTADRIHSEALAFEERKRFALTTGIFPFDRKHDGFLIGTSNAIVSKAKQGKSTMLTQIAVNSMAMGNHNLYVNIEDEKGIYYNRLGSMIGGVKRNYLAEREQMAKVFSELSRIEGQKGTMHTVHLPNMCNCRDIILVIRQLRTKGYPIRGVFVDQLSLMDSNKPQKELRFRYDAVAREMNETAKQEDLVVFTVLQSTLTKESGKSRSLDEADIAEAKGVTRHFVSTLGLTRGHYEIVAEDLGRLTPFKMAIINTRMGGYVSAEFVGRMDTGRIYSDLDTRRYMEIQGDDPEATFSKKA